MGRLPLRIALVGPFLRPLAEPFNAGIASMIVDLARGLIRRGHKVSLYAASGSHVPGVPLIEHMTTNERMLADTPINPQNATQPLNNQDSAAALNLFFDVRQRAAYDVMHLGITDWNSFAFAALSTLPSLVTITQTADFTTIGLMQTLQHNNSYPRFVTVSQACAETYRHHRVSFDRVIYHGVDPEQIPYSAEPPSGLLFVGNIAPERGAHMAIEIARRADKKLTMIGQITNRSYFDHKVKPLIEQSRGDIEYLGALPRADVFQHMARAGALLVTTTWPEIFGMVKIEAQAAGTPVIAFNIGATPETVRHERTGFLIPPGDLDGAVVAVKNLGRINRADCRQYIIDTFSVERMIDAYESYYYTLLA